ncbi:MAG TPA: tetratricopeptide repeat protein, partial [Ktedonobacterales bacterium]|nr:tetratricopeptide repeat protein [Ktedonobacterales bacterium]
LTPAARRKKAGQAPSQAPSQAPQAAPPTHVIATAGATHALRATEAFSRGYYHQAIQQGQAAVAQGHTTADLLFTLARSYQQVGRPLEAAEAFERAAQTRPDAAALVAAAQAWRAVGRLDEAQVDLAKARQLTPDDAEASYLLGLVNLELGHLAQAEGDLRDTVRLASGSSDSARLASALTALGRIQTERGQLDEAVETLRQAIAADPVLGEARWRLGRALLAQRHYSEAIRELEESARLDARSAEAQVTLGMAYHATGRRQRAREALREALRISPNHAEAQRLLKAL